MAAGAVGPAVAVDSGLEAALVRALGPQKTKVVEVDLAESMTKCGLAKFFLPDQWPDSGAVRELASQMRGKHGPKKFVAVELRK